MPFRFNYMETTPSPSVPSTPAAPALSPRTLTFLALGLGIALFFSLLANGGLVWQVFHLAVENQSLTQRATVAEGSLSEETRRADDAERRLGSASARAEELASVGTYFKKKFQDLDAILLETDSNSVDFIDWMVDNASFDDVKDAEDRYDAWTTVQDKTNEEYWALSEEVTSYITALEGGDLPQGSGT